MEIQLCAAKTSSGLLSWYVTLYILKLHRFWWIMDAVESGKLTTKVFIGFEFPLELRMELNSNPNWKQVMIENKNIPHAAKEIHYQDNDYLGFYLDFTMIPMKDLHQYAEKLKKQIQPYCTKTDVEKLKITIFSQVFIT